MKSYSKKTVKAILFDLDGTLLDTSEGCIESVIYAAKEIGIEFLTRETAEKFVGPPIQYSFVQFCHCTEEQAQRGADSFRYYYKTKALFKAKLYPGILEVLGELKRHGIKIGVATYKREDYAITILEHFGIAPYCITMHGADNFNKMTKADIVDFCIEELKTEKDNVILVGDTEHDALGAEKAGVHFLGVTYGFGFKTKSDVDDYPNVGCANTTNEILNFI